MKAMHLTMLVFVMLVLGVLPLQNAQSDVSGLPVNPSAFMPWKTQNMNAMDTPKYISVGWGSTKSSPQKNYPLVSHTQAGDPNHIWFMRPAVTYVGDCGPGNAWNCSMLDVDTESNHISKMQTYAFQNTFKVGWVYKDYWTNAIRLHTLELTQGLENAGDSDVKIVDIGSIFNNSIILDPPSIAFDEYGNLHMAVPLGFGDTGRLIYAHKINTTPSTPCNSDPNTRYQCDIIFETSGAIHDPKLVLNADNQPRISWLNVNPDSLMYAYPQSNASLHPNCGPGGNTWRCISIKDSTSDVNFFQDNKLPLLDMAIGPGSPHMLAKKWDTEGRVGFLWAKFVGSGGNCGEDYLFTGGFFPSILVNRWWCDWNVWDTADDNPLFDFAIKVDSLDYAIIALNRYVNGISKIGVLYYSERRGLPPGNWYFDLADSTNWPTGRGVSMAIGKNDRLLLGYARWGLFDDYLKTAIQEYRIWLPNIRK